MPEPLVMADVDLRGYEYMPLYGHHLFGSDFNARVSDAGWRAALTLWWAAWNQVPAASLPNDDAALARLADLGRDVKAFRKIKSEALHGFVECSDGRLYHATLAKWALEAWDRRVKERQRKANWRAARHKPGDGDETGTGRGHDTGHGVGHQRDVPSEGKRSEAKRRDVENRESKETPDITARADGCHFAISYPERQTQTQGQEWSDPAYVSATAQTLGLTKRTNETEADFRDRVYVGVQDRIRDGKAEAKRRASH